MNKHNEIDVDSILLKIQAVAAKARSVDGITMSKPISRAMGRSGNPASGHTPERNEQRILEQLLTLRDEEFVHAGYRVILQRRADPDGLAFFLTSLREGSLSRLEILFGLRFSEEGRRVGVLIPGLTRSYWTSRIARLPFIGYFLRIVYGICRLPVLMKNLDAQDAHAAHEFSLIRQLLSTQDAHAAREFSLIRQLLSTQDAHAAREFSLIRQLLSQQEVVLQRTAANAIELQQHVARQEFVKANRKDLEILDDRVAESLSVKAGREELAAVAEQLASIGPSKANQKELMAIAGRVAQCENSRVDPSQLVVLSENIRAVTHQVAICRQDLHDQHRSLGLFLELARKRLPEQFTPGQVTELLSEGNHFLDSLYVAFEDRYRGNREAIQESLNIYLPYVEKVAVQGSTKLRVLDVACGRGEWLELLRAHGYPARGVDVNRVALQRCEELGLDAVEEDALEFLRKQPKNTFSAVTCFHYVEHVDYPSLIVLLDECLRVLIPGGLAIFETPNIRNILVSAGDFYRDPTHRNPVFPETLEFIGEFRGFAESSAYFFNDTRTELIPITKFGFDDLNAYINISRDVAWIGVKSL
jgi:SAM-dependent methyltransferase